MIHRNFQDSNWQSTSGLGSLTSWVALPGETETLSFIPKLPRSRHPK
jgi:hypothetical protein